MSQYARSSEILPASSSTKTSTASMIIVVDGLPSGAARVTWISNTIAAWFAQTITSLGTSSIDSASDARLIPECADAGVADVRRLPDRIVPNRVGREEVDTCLLVIAPVRVDIRIDDTADLVGTHHCSWSSLLPCIASSDSGQSTIVPPARVTLFMTSSSSVTTIDWTSVLRLSTSTAASRASGTRPSNAPSRTTGSRPPRRLPARVRVEQRLHDLREIVRSDLVDFCVVDLIEATDLRLETGQYPLVPRLFLFEALDDSPSPRALRRIRSQELTCGLDGIPGRDAGRLEQIDELADPLCTTRRLDANGPELGRRIATHDGATQQAFGTRSQLDAPAMQLRILGSAGRSLRRVEGHARVDQLLLGRPATVVGSGSARTRNEEGRVRIDARLRQRSLFGSRRGSRIAQRPRPVSCDAPRTTALRIR